MGQCFRRDYLICYSPQERGGCVGSQRRFLASHICDGSKSARRRWSNRCNESRERETRGPKRPLGSPAEARASLSCHSAFCLSVLWPLLSSVGVLSHPEHCALPALGLCCLPPPPPCAGESIRQFTLGATGIPPGYTLRLGIKSGSQWRRSTSYRTPCARAARAAPPFPSRLG